MTDETGAIERHDYPDREALAIALAAGIAAGCGRDDTSGVIARVDDSELSADEFYASIPDQLLAVMSLDDQEEALKTLEENQSTSEQEKDAGAAKEEGLQKRQKGAARKLGELGKALEQGVSMGGSQSIAEDAEMLRQILDNLITFSIEQEALFKKVQGLDENAVSHSADIRKQKELRALF